MVLVSIDVEGANAVVSSLRKHVDAAMAEWTQVANAAGRGLCSVSPLHGLSDPLIGISRLAGELETRVELAVAYNTGDDGVPSSDPVLSYTLPGDVESIEAVKGQLGIEIAQGIESLTPHNKLLRRDDVVALERYTDLLTKYAGDESVMNGLFAELGPQGVVRVPIMLKDFAASYEQGLTSASDGDQYWEGTKLMSSQIADLQQQFMQSFGNGLAIATTSAAFKKSQPGFADGLVTAATEAPDGAGWGLSEVLRHGAYDGGFLDKVGAGLYEWEKDQQGPVWSSQLNGEVITWRLGTDDKGAYFDPFVGLFEAMGRNPQGAVDFFDPDGGGAEAKARSKYLIQDRKWKADDFNALGEALDAAATGFHSPNASVELQTQSAWVASAAINYLGERDPGRNNRRIGDAGKDSLGHILATYIVDVDRTANGADGELGVFRNVNNSPWKTGLPIGADMSTDSLRDVMAEVLTDPSAVAQMAEASNAWNANRIEYAADHWGGEGTDSGDLKVAINTSSALNGFVVGVMGVGLEDEARGMDERAQQYIDLTSDIVGLIPTGGTFSSFMAGQALSAGADAASGSWTGNESRVKDEQHTVQQVAYTDLQIAMAVALAKTGKLDAEALTFTNEAGDAENYSWFSAAGFDGDSLADPAVRNQFIDWLANTDSGSTMADLRPAIASMFEAGFNLGVPR